MDKIARCIRKLALSLAVLSAMLLPVLGTAPAQAQNWHSWVSNSGVDGNPCTEGSPCATFARALTQTDAGGEISCINSGSYIPATGFTITQSVTIDCNGTLAWANGDTDTFNGTAITINGSGIVVHLRNLSISGIAGDGLNQNGVLIQAAALVQIENCTIKNFTQSGINVATSANTILNVRNTSIVNTGFGIDLAPSGGAPNGSIDHVMIAKMTGSGITTGAGASVYFTVTNSVITNAAVVGVNANPGAVLEVDSSSVSNNNTAFAATGGAIIRISRNVIYDNNTNFSITGGTIATSGDNKVAVNGSTVPNGTITQQ